MNRRQALIAFGIASAVVGVLVAVLLFLKARPWNTQLATSQNPASVNSKNENVISIPETKYQEDEKEKTAPSTATRPTAENILGDDFLDAVLDEELRGLIPASIPLRMRLGEQVRQLKDESVEESLQMLSQVEMFYWPGHPMGVQFVVLPLDAKTEQITVERIMSNRRFLKVFQELSEMSKTAAGHLVSQEIERTLPAYKAMSEECWNYLRGQDQSPRSNPPSFNQISNNADGSPTLYGLRHKLLSLVLIAGNLELADSTPAIEAIVKEAYRQRDLSYGAAAEFQSKAWMMIHDVALYNRTILATGIIGTSGLADGQLAQGDGKPSDEFEARHLTHYDAAATPYDLLTRGDGLIPADFTKGEIFVKFHKGLDDTAFDKLVSSFVDGGY